MSRALPLLACLSMFLGGCEALYGAKSEVRVLDPAGLRKVLQGPEIVLLEFFAPWCGHCRNLVPDMEKAAKALKGVVVVAAVDADAHKELAGQYQVQGFPTIMLFSDDRSKPIPHNGGRSAQDLVTFALREAQKSVESRLTGKKKGKKSRASSDVVELTDSNFQKEVLESGDLWLVEFFAPWCGHCKNLAPEWESAATELKGSAKLGAVDATVHGELASRYGVKGYPTIKVFGAAKDRPDDYNGQRSSSGIVAHALSVLDTMGVGPEVNELTSAAALKEDCLEKKRLCIVGVLPHVMDTGAAGRNKYIEAMVAAAKKLRSHSVAFAWVGAGAQQKFEDMFNIAYNYPTFAAISNKKGRYASHMGTFDAEGIVASIKKIEGGKVATKPCKDGFADSFVTTEPWDGKDYVAPEEDL